MSFLFDNSSKDFYYFKFLQMRMRTIYSIWPCVYWLYISLVFIISFTYIIHIQYISRSLMSNSRTLVNSSCATNKYWTNLQSVDNCIHRNGWKIFSFGNNFSSCQSIQPQLLKFFIENNINITFKGYLYFKKLFQA